MTRMKFDNEEILGVEVVETKLMLNANFTFNEMPEFTGIEIKLKDEPIEKQMVKIVCKPLKKEKKKKKDGRLF